MKILSQAAELFLAYFGRYDEDRLAVAIVYRLWPLQNRNGVNATEFDTAAVTLDDPGRHRSSAAAVG